MGLTLNLSALSVPAGTEFPATVQALLNLIAQYEAIAGGATFNGVNFGDTTPAAADRDKAWIKTDASGNLIGIFSWNGSAWVTVSLVVPRGTTANRPASPDEGQLYLDTDINVILVYERAAWRTLSGSPGDIKFVQTALLADALTANPGWVELNEAAYAGRVLGVAGAGTGLTARSQADAVGEEAHAQSIAELAAHTHTGGTVKGSNADIGDPGPYVLTTTLQPNGDQSNAMVSGPAGSGTAFNVMQPTKFLWALVKS